MQHITKCNGISGGSGARGIIPQRPEVNKPTHNPRGVKTSATCHSRQDGKSTAKGTVNKKYKTQEIQGNKYEVPLGTR